MSQNAPRVAFASFLIVALIAALVPVFLREPPQAPVHIEESREPVALIPDLLALSDGRPSGAPLEALPPENLPMDDDLPPLASGEIVMPPTLESIPDPALSAALRPAPKPPSLLPLESVSRILIEKSKRRITIYVGDQIARIWPIALGKSPVGDKSREGDNRTPEGVFRVDRLNSASEYHLALGIDYPQEKHRTAAKALGISPGGDIMIHGQPNLSFPLKLPGDWTAGCIALTDDEIEELFAATQLGTLVEIRP
jgi:lipoprotein-anchoring transpeptidase ErfK/SrfK